jgi:uncharacterized protein (DUF488 family)
VAAKETRLTDDDSPLLFTIGYSGRTPESLMRALKAAGVTQLLDVRSVPRSRKPGFSGEALRASSEAAGLSYVHLPKLGAPRELLERKKGGAEMADIAPAYTKHLAGQRSALREAASLARKTPSALLCLEKDPSECHRGILSKRLAREGFRVEHL